MTDGYERVTDEFRRLDDELSAAVTLPAVDTVIRRAGTLSRANTAAAAAVLTVGALGATTAIAQITLPGPAVETAAAVTPGSSPPERAWPASPPVVAQQQPSSVEDEALPAETEADIGNDVPPRPARPAAPVPPPGAPALPPPPLPGPPTTPQRTTTQDNNDNDRDDDRDDHDDHDHERDDQDEQDDHDDKPSSNPPSDDPEEPGPDDPGPDDPGTDDPGPDDPGTDDPDPTRTTSAAPSSSDTPTSGGEVS